MSRPKLQWVNGLTLNKVPRHKEHSHWCSLVLCFIHWKLDWYIDNVGYCNWAYPPKPLQWRHNERDNVSNHQPNDCLLNCFFKAQIKGNIKALRHWPFVRGIYQWPVNSLRKGPVTQKIFPFDDVIMSCQTPILCNLVYLRLYRCL